MATLNSSPAHLPHRPPTLLGESASIQAVRRTIAQVAGTNLTVLLQGESGTGKEIAARLIASSSGRPDSQFVKVNCAAIPLELLESELFGYEPGAFTGANRQKSGKFDLASDGTIFLDEISELTLALQAKLLQVLQDGEFSRLGGHRSHSVDARVIAATNLDLRQAVADRSFRRDLFYRLNVISMFLPPLRERPEDIGLLTDYFLEKFSAEYDRPIVPFSHALRQRLLSHSWPGNVRELENLIKRHVILGDERALLPDLMDSLSHQVTPVPSPSLVPQASPGSLLDRGRAAAREAERQALLDALVRTRWNRRQAASHLQISYKSLQNKIKSLLNDRPAQNGNL
ncbi:MAG TPA: sigma-54 dependent transcriptional regulator [Terriglobales bacterium]|nr:sigma-54 dependent transcriptional regulator [Terriglobales bacterium]